MEGRVAGGGDIGESKGGRQREAQGRQGASLPGRRRRQHLVGGIARCPVDTGEVDVPGTLKCPCEPTLRKSASSW